MISLFLSRFPKIRCNACKNEGASFGVSLDYLSAVVFVTEFEAVFLHKFLGVITKAESMAINIDGYGFSFHLVESRGIGLKRLRML